VATIVDVYLLLDILLAILIALFIPIGFWRGVYREAFVTLGILFGAALGRFWGESWGAELAAVTRLQESGGAFMVAMLCLISATFLLGYSSGAALPVADPGWVSRLLGALIAGANGALLLSFALHDIREYLLTADETGFLDNAYIAPFLSDGTGWILLVAAAIFVPIALVLALFGPDIEEEEYYEEDEFDVYEESYPDPYAQRTMQRQGYAQQSAPPARPAPAPAPAEETRPIPSARPQQSQEATRPQHVQKSPESQQATRPQHGQQSPESQEATRPQPEQSPEPSHQANRQQHGPPIPEDLSRAAQTQPETPEESAETPRHTPESDETQPHRPQFGPQPTRDEPVVRTGTDELPGLESEQQEPQREPSFGTHSVERSIDQQNIVFGHRPAASSSNSAAPQSPERACPHCRAKVPAGVTGACPECGGNLESES
jgi:uncharacterized membrane protein required for colicin V production